MTCGDDTNILPIVREPVNSLEERLGSLSQMRNQIDHPFWILFAIEDLSQFCHDNKLMKSFAALERASRVLEDEIFPK